MIAVINYQRVQKPLHKLVISDAHFILQVVPYFGCGSHGEKKKQRGTGLLAIDPQAQLHQLEA